MLSKLIPKKYIYLSLALFAFNMFVSITTMNHRTIQNGIEAFFIATIPIWGCVMVGSILGFFILFFLPKNIEKTQRYLMSKIYGILVCNLLFTVYYLYLMMLYAGVK